MSKLQKIISVTLAVTTTLWLSGVAMLAPTAQAVTINEGDLIRGPDGIKVYIVNDKGFKRHIFNPEVFNMYGHFSWGDIKDVSQATLDSYETSDLYRAAGDPKVYSLEEIDEAAGNAVKHWLDITAQEFVDAGYTWDQVFVVNSTERDYYETGDPITAADLGLEGPSQYDNQADCEDAGYYWYDSACHEEAQAVTGLDVSVKDSPNFAAPKGATHVNMMEFTVTAGEDATIHGMTFERKGMGSRDDFDALSLYKGNKRLTTERTISSDNQVIFTSVDYDLEEGDEVTFTLMGETGTGTISGDTDYFALTAMDADAEVSGLPVEGPTVSLAATTAGSIEYDLDDISDTYQVGDQEVTLEEVNLDVSNEDVEVESIAFTQYGTVDMAEIDNLVLEVDNEVVAEGQVSGDLVMFTLDEPYLIEQGDDEDFTVKGDITTGAYLKGDAGKVDLRIDSDSDVYAVGQDYGFGASVDQISGDTVTNEITIEGGEVNLSYAGPGNIDVASEVDEQELFSFDISTVNELEVRELQFDITASTNVQDSDTSNFYVVDENGTKVAGPQDEDDTSSPYADDSDSVTFTTNFTVPSGEHTYSLVADLQDLSDGETIKTDLDIANSTFKDLDAGETLSSSDITPSTTLSGKTLTVNPATLTVEAKAHPVAQSYVAGQDKAVLGAFNLSANEVLDVDINDVEFSLAYTDEISGASASNLFNQLYLYQDSTNGELIDSVSPDDTPLFDVDKTIAAGGDIDLVLAADIRSDVDNNYTLDPTVDDNVTATLGEVDGDINKGTLKYDPTNASDNDATTGLSAPAMTLVKKGSLTVSLSTDNNPTQEDIAVMGSKNVLFSAYTLEADNEDINVDEVKIDIGNAAEDVDYTNIVLKANGTEVASGDISGQTKTFINADFTVPKNGKVELKVFADLATEIEGANSGDELDIAVTKIFADGAISDASADVTVSETETTFALYKTKPTFAITSAAGTGDLVSGTVDAMDFTVAADENAGVELNKLTFDLATNSATVGGAELIRSGEADVTGTVSGGNITFSSFDHSISANSSATYTLRLTSISGLTTGSSVTIEFSSASGSEYEWDDGTRASGTWADGQYFILPSDVVNITYQQ